MNDEIMEAAEAPEADEWKDIQNVIADAIHRAVAQRDARIAELEAVVKKNCEWREFDADDMPGTYETSCGRTFSCTEDGIHENRITHCPFLRGRDP